MSNNDETKEMAHDSQKVIAKENLKLSRGVRPTTNIRHQHTNERFWSGLSLSVGGGGRTHRRAIKEETMVVIAYCRKISMLYPTFYKVWLSL